jgi:U3 small nucleolar RNA-associated protein MPP10
MRGEVAATDRPRDALLDTDLVLEHALPSAPVITEALTARLEERLKKRILANNFDDVVRRNPRAANLIGDDARAQRILQQDLLDAEGQKSKASLVDLYEKDFLDRQQKAQQQQNGGAGGGAAAAEALTPLEQDELKALQQWRRIAQHLDALSNFHFTPKPIAADLDARVRAVNDQAPAISVESKGMFALSRDKVLAPQDIFRPRTTGGGAAAASGATKAEMTPGEKKSLRAAHKRSHQVSQALAERRKHQSEAQKKGNAAAPAAAASATKKD